MQFCNHPNKSNFKIKLKDLIVISVCISVSCEMSRAVNCLFICLSTVTIMMYILLLIGLTIILPFSSGMYYGFQTLMKPCPKVQPQKDVNIEKILGTWHLSLVVLDATTEDFVEAEICVSGELQRYNRSVIRQVWTIDSIEAANEPDPSVMVDFPTSIIQSGVWAVHTPLGGQMKATVFESDPSSYMMVTHCGQHRGKLVHLWTAAVTRSRVIPSALRLKLTKSLLRHGFDPDISKVITWETC